MMTIKIKLSDDEITTNINGTLVEIAEYYFSNPEVISIEILSGAVEENEYFRCIPLEIFRVSQEEIEKFELQYNIRLKYKIEYKQGQANDHTTSRALCKVS